MNPDWILAFVGALTFIAVGWQAWETRRAASASSESARLSADALYLLEGASLQWQETEWKQPPGPYRETLDSTLVSVLVRNFGRSIARDVVFDLTLGIPGTGITNALPKNPPIVMAPNQTWPYAFQRPGQIMDQESLDRVAAGQSPLLLWGSITYTDVFDRATTLRMSAIWIPGTNGFAWDSYESHKAKRHRRR